MVEIKGHALRANGDMLEVRTLAMKFFNYSFDFKVFPSLDMVRVLLKSPREGESPEIAEIFPDRNLMKLYKSKYVKEALEFANNYRCLFCSLGEEFEIEREYENHKKLT